LMQLGLFGTAPALVELREQQILRRLGATPLPRSTLLISQVLLRVLIAVIQTALLIGIILGGWLLVCTILSIRFFRWE